MFLREEIARVTLEIEKAEREYERMIDGQSDNDIELNNRAENILGEVSEIKDITKDWAEEKKRLK